MKRQPLPPEQVGNLPCTTCGKSPMALPGSSGGVCIRCYATERNAESRRAAGGSSWAPANFVSDPCLGCNGSDVHANGWAFWCNTCGMAVRIA